MQTWPGIAFEHVNDLTWRGHVWQFSDVIRDAKEKGFTEPDPRDDLSGTDVARKVEMVRW